MSKLVMACSGLVDEVTVTGQGKYGEVRTSSVMGGDVAGKLSACEEMGVFVLGSMTLV